MKDGWNKIERPANTNYVNVNILVSDEMLNDSEIIKDKLNYQLIKKLKKSKYIKYTKHARDVFGDNEYTATINVTDLTYNNAIVEDNHFYYNNKQYSEDELIRAIKNTYPEDLI
jgi:hypothetical protein